MSQALPGSARVETAVAWKLSRAKVELGNREAPTTRTAPSKDYRNWAQEVALERAALAAYRLADTLASALPTLDAIRGSVRANGHRKDGASDATADGATNGHRTGANGHSTTRKRKPRRRTHATG